MAAARRLLERAHILSEVMPRGNVILVEGAVGTGQTTVGVEFVYRGASEFDEPGLIVLFEVSPERIRYRLYRVVGKQAGNHSHLWESSWPSAEVYDKVHESAEWQAVDITPIDEILSKGHDRPLPVHR